MANSANPEINKKIATSALGTLVIATVFFYLGDRYAETLVTYPGQIFDHLSDAFLSMWQTIKDAPFALDMTSNSLLFGGACFLIIWMIWLRYVAFIGNYRSGEESGSARWGTLKEPEPMTIALDEPFVPIVVLIGICPVHSVDCPAALLRVFRLHSDSPQAPRRNAVRYGRRRHRERPRPSVPSALRKNSPSQSRPRGR